MTSDQALLAITALASVGVVIDAAETTAGRSAIRQAFELRILETVTVRRLQRRFPWPLVDVGDSGLAAWQALRVLGALVAVAGAATSAGALLAAGAATALAGQIALGQRLVLGLDGADQMLGVVWAGLVIASVVPAAGLALIAAQSLLSYLVAGVAKAAGPEWRRGSAPRQIVATAAYGSPRAVALMRVPGVSILVAWSTIGFEVAGPVVVLALPTTFAIATFVTCAIVFHLGIALTMGLNTFLWAFTAPLAAIAWFGPI